MTAPPFSDYIVYADESGDHGLEGVDPNYPLFILAFCIFEKTTYSSTVCPRIQGLKFKHFGEDTVILHERDIKKGQNRFSILADPVRRTTFISEVCDVIRDSPFTLVAIAIRKDLHRNQYSSPDNPYMLAMEMGLERVCKELQSLGQVGKLTHVVFECRGRKEDAELELEFRRVIARNAYCRPTPLEIVMCDKRGNASGLQVADLVAGPIGAKILRPTHAQRAYDLIKPKFRKSSAGAILGWGLKVFPPGDLTGLGP